MITDRQPLTGEQVGQFMTLLNAGRFDPDKADFEKWAFQRGFNPGIEFAELQLKKAMGQS